MHKNMPIAIQNLSKNRIGPEGIRLGDKLREQVKYLKETVKIYITLMAILAIIGLAILWHVVEKITGLLLGIKTRVKNRSKYDTNK